MSRLSVSAMLRDGCEPTWSGLADHPFVRRLADGTLEPERFRFYLEQNLFYLPRYARVMALGVAKARDERELRLFAAALHQVIEVEIPENRELLQRVCELGAEDRGGALEATPATLAYTTWLESVAFAGGTPEILAAVLPCTWSYGDIAKRLAPGAPHPIYADWIAFFASDAYSHVVDRMRRDTDELIGAVGGPELGPLADIFRTGVRLERGFWDMAFGLADWSKTPSDI
jgi:thiaminase (transcriptional activator TenA)